MFTLQSGCQEFHHIPRSLTTASSTSKPIGALSWITRRTGGGGPTPVARGRRVRVAVSPAISKLKVKGRIVVLFESSICYLFHRIFGGSVLVIIKRSVQTLYFTIALFSWGGWGWYFSVLLVGVCGALREPFTRFQIKKRSAPRETIIPFSNPIMEIF